MLRITRNNRLDDEVVLVLEGQIVGEWVELLEAECLDLSGTQRKLFLDLAGVSYLDRRAVRLLGKLASRSVTLINCPPLVYELVQEDAQ